MLVDKQQVDRVDQVECASQSIDAQQVPVLVLTGSLGSGKTTVINAMLELGIIPDHYNVLLLENDIGRANQDYARVNLPDHRKIPLTSGCVCCRSLGQLSTELKRIQGLPAGSRPDLILVETTGIAHPDVIKSELRQMGIPSVVAVTLDVAHFEDNVRLNLVDRGIIAADKIILTWWDGIVSPESLNHPKLDRIRRYTGDRELEAITLGAKRRPAEHVYFKPARELHGILSEAAFYGADNVPLLLPAADDLSECTRIDFSTSHQAIKAKTVHFKDSVTVADLMHALVPFREAGGSILRIKAEGFDMVHNETGADATACELRGPVNIITTPAFDLDLIAHLVREDEVESSETAHSRSLEAAVKRLIYMTERHPRNPVYDDYIQMEFHENEAYDYADRTGVPAELRDAFYAVAIEARTNSLRAITSGDWDHHSDIPYYKWRIGSQAVWWILNRAEDLERNGVLDTFIAATPASLYFDGLRSITSYRHVDELKDATVPWMETVYQALVSELGDARQAREIALRAYQNCRELDQTGTWNEQWQRIEEFLNHSPVGV